MKFNYKITSAGWAICELEVSNQQFTFEVSWISDALKEFLEAIVRLNPDVDPDYYEDETECSWHQEPGLVEWDFKISDIKSDEKNLFLTVKQYEDDSRRHRPFIDVKFSCNYDEFVSSIVGSLESLLREFGLVGYSEMWGGADFPIAHYLKLKQYAIDKTIFPNVTEETDNTIKTTTSLDYEMKLLTM
ncbi:hypothetical protein MHH37_17175 [Solibacillus sp. FSL K6-1781]|uniref:hypothetical protein n=1 Tax=Solibacillus sp. FSL K6-1781 TaxID=2921474 RepID=UPI00315B170D